MNIIHHAAATGDCASIGQALTQNPHCIDMLDPRGKEGLTPLQLATSQNKLAAVNFLIQKGADINKRSKHDMTALILACMQPSKFTENDRTQMISALINAGARLDLNNPLDAKALGIFKEKYPNVYAQFSTIIAQQAANSAASQTDGLMHRTKQASIYV